MATVAGRIFVYGGKGALGSVCVSKFKAENWVSVLFLSNSNIFRKSFCLTLFAFIASGIMFVCCGYLLIFESRYRYIYIATIVGLFLLNE